MGQRVKPNAGTDRRADLLRRLREMRFDLVEPDHPAQPWTALVAVDDGYDVVRVSAADLANAERFAIAAALQGSFFDPSPFRGPDGFVSWCAMVSASVRASRERPTRREFAYSVPSGIGRAWLEEIGRKIARMEAGNGDGV